MYAEARRGTDILSVRLDIACVIGTNNSNISAVDHKHCQLVCFLLLIVHGTQYDRELAPYCPLSVRLSACLSLTLCIVSKRYILQQKCLNK